MPQDHDGLNIINILFFFLFSMLDDMNTDLENADSKLDSTMKKVARVLHINNGKILLTFIDCDGCRFESPKTHSLYL